MRGRRLRTLAREPLVQFTGLALLLHAGGALWPSGEPDRFVLTEQDVVRHEALWTAQAGRPPSEAERAGLRAALTEEAALAREALRLGLAEDDVVIRRRLAQKARAVLRAEPREPPSETALRAWYDAHAGDYAIPARASLRTVFLGDEAGAAGAALDALADGAPWRSVGAPAPFRLAYAEATRAEIARALGPRFAEAAFAAPPGRWEGPVVSAYGQHLLFVERRSPAAPRPFAEARQAVAADLARARETEALAARIAEVVERHAAP